MKALDQVQLTPTQGEALAELRRKLAGSYGIREMKLYGSVARGEAGAESDLDLLLITDYPLERTVRHQITDIVTDINLRYDTNISTLVVDSASWEDGLFSVLPIRDEILREGVAL